MSEPGRTGSPRVIPAHPSISEHWRALFGGKVRRMSLDPGFSCPNRDKGEGCTFCDPATFAPSYGDRRSIVEQVGDGVARGRAKGANLFAAYFQPRTNTYAPLEELKKIWDEASSFPEVVALCVGTRPDCLSDEVLDLLASYLPRFGEIWLEIGLQSANDETLRRIGRGHDSACFADASRRARTRGLKVCAHVILGLPGEGPETEARTADFLAALDIDGVKLHQLAVIDGTPLALDFTSGDVPGLSEAGYAERAVAFVRRLPNGTVLHRLVGDTLGESEISPNFDKGRVLEMIRVKLAAENEELKRSW